jgi:hypothetical protein
MMGDYFDVGDYNLVDITAQPWYNRKRWQFSRQMTETKMTKAKLTSVEQSNAMVGALEETLEFLDGQEDVDEGQPNKAMQLGTLIREVIRDMGPPQGMETPRTASRLEAAALAASLVAEHGWEPQDALELVDRSWIAVFDRYMPDCPGYCGKVALVVWPGGVEQAQVFTFKGGVAHG